VVEGNRAADDAVCLCERVRDHGGEIRPRRGFRGASELAA
jgi:hypothetical protein